VQIDTKRWLLSKIAPSRFGDRITTEVTGADGKDLLPDAVAPDRLALAILAVLQPASQRPGSLLRLIDPPPEPTRLRPAHGQAEGAQTRRRQRMIDQLRRRADRSAARPAAPRLDVRHPDRAPWRSARNALVAQCRRRHDPELDRSPEFAAAFAGVDQAARAVELQHEAARLYHDPAIRKAAGDKLDRYWQHAQEAFEALVDQSAAHGLPRDLDRALDVIGEARQFATEAGIPEAAPEAPPVPASARELEFEIGELVQKSVSGTPLIERPEEDSRLNHLAGARAIEAGLVAPEDDYQE
jgi:hypothetical protein